MHLMRMELSSSFFKASYRLIKIVSNFCIKSVSPSLSKNKNAIFVVIVVVAITGTMLRVHKSILLSYLGAGQFKEILDDVIDPAEILDTAFGILAPAPGFVFA